MSGLLPRNQGPINASNGVFGTVTTGFLNVTNAATINDLTLTGVASDPTAVNALTLEPDGTVTFRSIASLPFEASDIYPNATPNHTVALVTTGGNANVLLSPNGTGKVVVQAATTLTADALAPTTSGGPLTVSTSGSASILLDPAPGGRVSVLTGRTLTADTIAPTAAAGPLTLETTGGNANILLSPDGTGKVVVQAATTLTTDALTPTTSGGPLTVSTSGSASILLDPAPGGRVSVLTGRTLTADTITPTAAAGPLTLETTGGNAAIILSPDGTGPVQSTGILEVNQISNLTSGAPLVLFTHLATSDNIELNPDPGGRVVVSSGTIFTADTIQPTTANTSLTIQTPPAAPTSGLPGKDVDITAGAGGSSFAGPPGLGGNVNIVSGHGGDNHTGGDFPGSGGEVTLTSGNGGAQDGTGPGAPGGPIFLTCGNGTSAGPSPNDGGEGGSYVLMTGNGGDGGTGFTQSAGSGGSLTLQGGAAGNGLIPVVGGNISIEPGSGSNGQGPSTGGEGGSLTMFGGLGGAQLGTGIPGAGGPILIIGGQGNDVVFGVGSIPGGSGGSVFVAGGPPGSNGNGSEAAGDVQILGGSSTGTPSPAGNVYINGGNGPTLGNTFLSFDPINGQVGNLAIFCGTTPYDITIDGTTNRTVGMTVAAPTIGLPFGRPLTIQAGQPPSGSTDANAGDIFIATGQSSGTGTAAAHIQCSMGSATSGTLLNAPTDRITLSGTIACTNGSPQGVIVIPFPDMSPPLGGSVFLTYTVTATDGTDIQVESGFIGFSVAKVGATHFVSPSLGPGLTQALSAGTLTTAWAYDTGSETITFTPTSSLTTTNITLAVVADNNATIANFLA